MLRLKLKYFLKPEPLNQSEKMYLLTRTCTCIACQSYTAAFVKTCSEDKRFYLDHMARV
jgi:hypothetical protein